MKKYINCFPPKEEIPGYNPDADDNEYFNGYYWWVQTDTDIAGNRLDTIPTIIELYMMDKYSEIGALMTGNELLYSENNFPHCPYCLVGPIEVPSIETLNGVE